MIQDKQKLLLIQSLREIFFSENTSNEKMQR